MLSARQLREWPIIDAARRGNWRPLIDLLRSGQEVSCEVGLLLADILDGKLKRPNHQPPKFIREVLAPAVRVLHLQKDPSWQKQEAAVAQVAAERGCCAKTVQNSLGAYKQIEAFIEHEEARAAAAPDEDSRLAFEGIARSYRNFLASLET